MIAHLKFVEKLNDTITHSDYLSLILYEPRLHSINNNLELIDRIVQNCSNISK